jgi:hypothetical protein
MAVNIERRSFGWVSNEGHDMMPGEVHEWETWPIRFGAVVSVTAHAVSGNPSHPERILEVEHVRIHRRLGLSDGIASLKIRNAGSFPIPGYNMSYTVAF